MSKGLRGTNPQYFEVKGKRKLIQHNFDVIFKQIKNVNILCKLFNLVISYSSPKTNFPCIIKLCIVNKKKKLNTIVAIKTLQ